MTDSPISRQIVLDAIDRTIKTISELRQPTEPWWILRKLVSDLPDRSEKKHEETKIMAGDNPVLRHVMMEAARFETETMKKPSCLYLGRNEFRKIRKEIMPLMKFIDRDEKKVKKFTFDGMAVFLVDDNDFHIGFGI